MTTMTISRSTLTKSAAALALTIGLAAQLTPTPAHAGKGALYFGAGVVTGVIINEAARSNRGYGYDAGPPPRRRAAPPPRRRSAPPRRNRRVVKREYFDPAEVEKIQTALTTLGFDPGVIDGAMGRRTRTAIRGFQFEIDMKQTGRLTKAQKIILFDRAAAAEANDTEVETDQGSTSSGNTTSSEVSPSTTTEDTTTADTTTEEIQDSAAESETTEVQPTTSSVSSRQGRIKVQKALTALGYPTGNEDGTVTEQTKEAIKAFQLDISHDATGLLTAEQRTILFNDAANIAAAEEDEETTEEVTSTKQQARIVTE